MKKLIFTSFLLLTIVFVKAQGSRAEILQDLEKSKPVIQDQQVTATLKSASRLFQAKEDITSVILIIPAGSVVNITGSDSTYYRVTFEENEGFIFRRDAIISNSPMATVKPNVNENIQPAEQPVDERQVSRFTYLENKYGTNMAARLYAGKIWKGMSAEMVKDSWGSPLKIDREIGNIVREKWYFRNTWLFIENNRLVDWGPIQR